MKKILVVALDNLGDAVMATSVLKPLKRLYPQASIGFWVKDYAAGLFVDQSFIDVVHACDPFWDKSPGQPKGGLGPFLKTFFQIRRQRYDAVLLLNTEWRRSLICSLAGIPKRIGFDRRKSAFFITQKVVVPSPFQHFIDDHRLLVEAMVGKKLDPHDFVPCLESVGGTLPREGIAMHIFSGNSDKDWPLSCWAELAQKLRQRFSDLKFLVILGPGQDAQFLPYRDFFRSLGVRELHAPRLSELKSSLKETKLFIGVDSGPAHIAAALETPVISLFGDASSPDRSRPIGRSMVKVFQKSPLRYLIVDDVYASAEEFLSRV